MLTLGLICASFFDIAMPILIIVLIMIIMFFVM